MTRQFSLAHLTVLGCPPPKAIHIARDTGYDFVSPRIIPLGEPAYDLVKDVALLRATKSALAETGLPILDIELARILPDVDVEAYCPALEIGAELGAKHVISSIWTPDHVFAAEQLAKLCDIAAPLGLTIDLEYLGFVPIGRLADVLAIRRAAARPNCGFLVDTIHSTGYDWAELDAIPRQAFNFIHLCDGPNPLPAYGTREMFRVVREGRLYVGEGEIDIAKLLSHLPNVPLSIELPNAAMVNELGYSGHAKRCLETARKYVAERVDFEAVQARPQGKRAST